MGQVLGPLLGQLVISDIAEIPDSAPITPFQIDQRSRISVEDLPICQSKLISAVLLPMTVEIFDPFGKNVGGLDSGQYMIENSLIISCAQKSIRYLEVTPELFICQKNMVGLVYNQNAINRRLSLRLQQRSLEQQCFLGPLPESDIPRDGRSPRNVPTSVPDRRDGQCHFKYRAALTDSLSFS